MAKYIEVVPGVYKMSFGELSADFEPADCEQCEFHLIDSDRCAKCGAEHAWVNYSREFIYTDYQNRPIYFTKQFDRIPYEEAEQIIAKYDKGK